MYYIYIFRNKHNRFYIGHTQNLKQRLRDHINTHGAKFIKDYGEFELAHTERFKTRADAMQREKQLKG